MDDRILLSEISTYSSGILQGRAYRKLKRVTSDILKKHGLSASEWFIIGTIYDSWPKGLSITELSKITDTSLAYLSKTATSLIKRNMLIKIESESDSRTNLINVTKSARKQIPEIESAVRTDMRRIIYPELTPEELQTYIQVLSKLSKI